MQPCHDSSKGARLYLGRMPGTEALDPVKSSLSNGPDVERSCQLSISKSRLIKAIRLRKSPRFIEASRGPLTSNRCQTQPEKRPTNAHVNTYTYRQSPRVFTWREGRKEGKLGVTLSPGNTTNSRYIQAEPTINLVPRRRPEVGGQKYERRATKGGHVEGRRKGCTERKRERDIERGEASTRTRKPPGQQITVYGLHPSPPPRPRSFSTTPVLSSSAYPSPGRPWLAHEVNNHQKSQCLSRAAALCAPTRAPDANTTPPGLYYELLELLHRRRIFTCSAFTVASVFLLYLARFFFHRRDFSPPPPPPCVSASSFFPRLFLERSDGEN